MIEVSELRKSYGGVEAVKGVSFSVGKEQVLGFLGPNGAGKTTIMKILTGYHYPTGGEALVDGLSVRDESAAVKSRIGYLPEGVPLYGELTVTEYLRFVSEARQIPLDKRSARIDYAVDACGLGEMRGRRIETLSKGYKQRTGLAGAIMHDPPILILDEPTTGLDPNQIIEIRALINELGKSKTVILSTHILQEVEAVCSQVLILNEGKIAAQGRPDEISLSMKGGVSWKMRVKTSGNAGKDELKTDFSAFSGNVSHKFNVDNKKIDAEQAENVYNISFLVNPKEKSEENEFAETLFDWAVGKNLKILSMSEQKLTLEDIFVRLTKDDTKKSEKRGKNG